MDHYFRFRLKIELFNGSFPRKVELLDVRDKNTRAASAAQHLHHITAKKAVSPGDSDTFACQINHRFTILSENWADLRTISINYPVICVSGQFYFNPFRGLRF